MVSHFKFETNWLASLAAAEWLGTFDSETSVALDATLADTKFQGSGYTSSRVLTFTRIILDQFFQTFQGPKSWHSNFAYKNEQFEAKTRLSQASKILNK